MHASELSTSSDGNATKTDSGSETYSGDQLVMIPGPASSNDIMDIIVSGFGVTSIFAALSLAKSGKNVLIVGKSAPKMPSRSVVLLQSSLRYLEWLGLLEEVTKAGEPIDTMHMIDDTFQLIPVPDVFLNAFEIGCATLGINILNDALHEILLTSAKAQNNILFIDADISDYDFSSIFGSVILTDRKRFSAALIVAADGHKSRAPEAANIDVRSSTYPQTALTFIIKHERPHQNIMLEYYTRSGPFTILPMPGQVNVPNRSSIVWVMKVHEARQRLKAPFNELEYEVESYSKSKLGAVKIEGSVGQFSLHSRKVSHYSRDRVALVGESSHVLPPIHAQGLNLSFRDVAELVACLAGIDLHNDIEIRKSLVCYNNNRILDVGSRFFVVDTLNRSLLAHYLPVDLLRGACMQALSSVSIFRRAVIKEAILPHKANRHMMKK